MREGEAKEREEMVRGLIVTTVSLAAASQRILGRRRGYQAQRPSGQAEMGGEEREKRGSFVEGEEVKKFL